METTNYEDVREAVMARARKHVWCSVATVDRAGRPRSRVLHPIWEGPHGWITTYPGSHKAKHLAQTPYISCGYVDASEPMYLDCHVSWVEDSAEKARVWDFIKAQEPEPYGFDPAMIWKNGPGGEDFGLLKLEPWRVEIYTASPGSMPEITIWRPA